MSDLVGNPEDRFSQVAALLMADMSAQSSQCILDTRGPIMQPLTTDNIPA